MGIVRLIGTAGGALLPGHQRRGKFTKVRMLLKCRREFTTTPLSHHTHGYKWGSIGITASQLVKQQIGVIIIRPHRMIKPDQEP
ncbi:hypothetical protein RJ45_22035 [Photobacterium gaetbulicola]|uniref:Uncharacterized protein n=1 Tax=Photobacterium gaetbulicola TaxID=1295392 RepID=A0A0B9FZE2_9GAMM|nr:hypothetical protein RJ45_22035 [Photobacterium gaetbulicola]